MVEIYLIDRKGKTLQRVGMSDYTEGLFEILQLLMDGMGEELFDADVALKDTRVDGFIDVKKLREKSGLRKRTFDEKLKNFKTWKWEEE